MADTTETKPAETTDAPKPDEKAGDGGYDRDAEKNQEIGDEFLNPDKEME